MALLTFSSFSNTFSSSFHSFPYGLTLQREHFRSTGREPGCSGEFRKPYETQLSVNRAGTVTVTHCLASPLLPLSILDKMLTLVKNVFSCVNATPYRRLLWRSFSLSYIEVSIGPVGGALSSNESVKIQSLAPDTIIMNRQFTPTSSYTRQDQSQLLGRGIDGSSITFWLEFRGLKKTRKRWTDRQTLI